MCNAGASTSTAVPKIGRPQPVTHLASGPYSARAVCGVRATDWNVLTDRKAEVECLSCQIEMLGGDAA